ncbi:hypothetical protein [Niveispirillum fermenti]
MRNAHGDPRKVGLSLVLTVLFLLLPAACLRAGGRAAMRRRLAD